MENSEKRLAVAFNNDQKAYTYTTYDSLIIKQQSAIQSLFNGACFYNCEITDCNFSRSDFEGMIASQNVFINVNYSNADIKSVCWNNCKFVSCIFNDAFLDGNQFIKCSFTDCFFSRSVCENNVFKYCDFNCTIFSVSTTTLNEFYHTEFCNTDLGDCSFYKNILFGCKYKNVAINVDSLGQTFGLKQSDLKVFSYIFLGKPLGKVSEPNYTKLRESFMSKHWYYETILLDHNTNRSSNYEYIIRVTDYICNCLVEKNVIKLDELRFFILVVDFMFERQSLPLLAMVYCYNRLNEQLQLIDNEYINYKDLKNCVIKIYFLIEEMLSKFHSMQEEVILPEDYFNVSLRYDSKDLIDFAKLTNNISSLLDLKSLSTT